MIKLVSARWFSLFVLGALSAGCHRADRGADAQVRAPVACVSSSPEAAAAPASAAPAVAATPGAVASSTAAAPAAKPAEKAASAKASEKPAKAAADVPLKVKRLVVAEGIERSKREPVNAKASFNATSSDKIYAFVEVENPTKSESEVFVTFEPQGAGASQGQVSLHVGSSARWRTWAFTRGAKKAGSWAAVVRSTDGTVLARTPFEVTL